MNPETLSQSTEIFSSNAALRLVAELYGLQVSAQPLPGEYDYNFHLNFCKVLKDPN